MFSPGVLPQNRTLLPCLILALAFAGLACNEEQTTAPVIGSPDQMSTTEEMSFAVGENHSLTVDNFVGNVTIRPGSNDTIDITATRWAPGERDFDQIEVHVTELDRALRIRTESTADGDDYAIDLDISVPQLGYLNLTAGVGDIDYEGQPLGTCRFQSGVGSITLRLPDDVQAYLELSAGAGTIDLEFAIDGLVYEQSAAGTIGTGVDAYVGAQTGAGNIYVKRQVMRM